MATNYIWNAQPCNQTVDDAARHLYTKERRTSGDANVSVDLGTFVPPKQFDERDKLTIVGHGSENAQVGRRTLAGKPPATLVKMINKAGFLKVPKIVLAMCGDSESGPAEEFVRELRQLSYQGLVVSYKARLKVRSSGRKNVSIPNPLAGLGIPDLGGEEEMVQAREARVVWRPD